MFCTWVYHVCIEIHFLLLFVTIPYSRERWLRNLLCFNRLSLIIFYASIFLTKSFLYKPLNNVFFFVEVWITHCGPDTFANLYSSEKNVIVVYKSLLFYNIYRMRCYFYIILEFISLVFLMYVPVLFYAKLMWILYALFRHWIGDFEHSFVLTESYF